MPKRKRLFEQTGALPSVLSLVQADVDYRHHARQLSHSYGRALLPQCLEERQIMLTSMNKLFAAKWLDHDNVLVGTKCNTFFKLNLTTEAVQHIERPPAPDRTFDTSTLSHGWGKCGIHCIDINPCGDLVATGGTEPADCVVFRTSDYSPVRTLIGHRDWLFGVAWVSDRHLVTGSRDRSVALWSVDPEDDSPVTTFDFFRDMKRRFAGKVRDVKYNAALGMVAALDTSGFVKLMDPITGLRVVRAIEVPGNQRELVSMVARQDMVAVGSLSHVALIDPRKRGTNALITSLASPDVDEGVRSVCLADNLLSFGTGKGKIAFYDIRAAKFLPAGGRQPLRPSTHANPTIETEGAVSPRAQLPFGLDPSRRAAGDEGLPSPREDEYIKVGEGWVERDESYWDYFAGMKVTHACYAHAWDPTGTRLFACGGPLQFGLKGGYCALYE